MGIGIGIDIEGFFDFIKAGQNEQAKQELNELLDNKYIVYNTEALCRLLDTVDTIGALNKGNHLIDMERFSFAFDGYKLVNVGTDKSFELHFYNKGNYIGNLINIPMLVIVEYDVEGRTVINIINLLRTLAEEDFNPHMFKCLVGAKGYIAVKDLMGVL